MHVIDSLEGGGTERTLVALLRAFDPSVCRHAVVTMRGAGALAARLPDHVSCRPISATGRSRWAGVRVARAARLVGACVIHARNTGCWFDATIAALLTPRVRLVLGFHGLERGGGLTRRQRRITRGGLRAGARFTSVSQAGRRQLHEDAGVPLDHIEVLPNGIDLPRFSSAPADSRQRSRSEFHFSEGDFVVGIVGSLTPVKRHDALIRAVARAGRSLPHLRLLVVGDGPLRTVLHAQAQKQEVEDRIRFAGRREDVPALLAAMDAYVCSSESEGMSNALLEAMATGLAVIATDVGDHSVIIRHKVDGLIVKSGSSVELADALMTLACTRHLRARLAAASRVRARDFDFASSVRAYEKYYKSLLPASVVNAQPGLASPTSGNRPAMAS